MAVDLLKVAFSVLHEISEGKYPNADNYGISNDQFGSVIEDLVEKGYLKNAVLIRGGMGNKVHMIMLNGSQVTLDGLEYLHENSALMKTYKGLKEVRDWIPFY